MTPALDGYAALHLAGLLQGLIVAPALAVRQRGDRVAMRLLAAIAATLAILQGGAVLIHTRWILTWPHLSQIHVPFQFLLAPLIWLWVRRQAGLATTRIGVWHALPSVVALLWLLPFYFQDAAAKREFLAAALDAYPREWYIRNVFLVLQQLAYLSECVRITATARPWLRRAVYVCLGLWSLTALRFVIHYGAATIYLNPLSITGMLFAIGYVGLVTPERLTGEPPRYLRSRLTPVQAGDLIRKATNLLAGGLCLDPALTLESLAARLQVIPNHLSQAVNEQTGGNFADFVNAPRIDEVKRRLLDPAHRHLTIAGIAADCGFPSKSAFHSAFRKQTGMTPSEFRNGMRTQS